MTPGCWTPSSAESTDTAISTRIRPIQVRAFGRRSAAWPIDSPPADGGSMIHSAAYSRIPTPPVKVSTTNRIRKKIGSMLK
jgi:hypothetical protein